MRTGFWLLPPLLLLGCAGEGGSSDGPDATDATPASSPASAADSLPAALIGTSWRWVSFQSMDDATGTVRPDDPDAYTLRLAADGSVGMTLDCNQGRGSWTASAGESGVGGSFTFGALAVTRALCPPPSLGERVASDAEYVRSWLLEDGRLHLSLLADGGIYTWEPLPESEGAGRTSPSGAADAGVPRDPSDGGPLAWTVREELPEGLALKREPSAASETVAVHGPGTILDHLGCQRTEEAEDAVWCYVQEMGGGPVGFVPAADLDPAISPDGSVAMGPNDSALRAGQGDFDATGTIPCARSAGQPTTACPFGVARSGGGYATVVVELTGGGERVLYFSLGRPISVGTSEADLPGDLSAREESGLHLIRVGEERYELPREVVLGG